jgi:glyoxylase-like metal-dependent hydrolase (beta-lactamase superfamily II)
MLTNGNVFTGDTLFVGSVGRTDFPGSYMKKTEGSGHTLHRYNLKFVALTISKKKKRMNKILSSAS